MINFFNTSENYRFTVYLVGCRDRCFHFAISGFAMITRNVKNGYDVRSKKDFTAYIEFKCAGNNAGSKMCDKNRGSK